MAIPRPPEYSVLRDMRSMSGDELFGTAFVVFICGFLAFQVMAETPYLALAVLGFAALKVRKAIVTRNRTIEALRSEIIRLTRVDPFRP